MKPGFIGILMPLLFAAGCFAQQDSVTKIEKTAIINKALNLLRENYIFPARVNNIEQNISSKLSQGAYDSLTTWEPFLEDLNTDLERSGNDHHLDISYGPKRVKQIISDEQNEKEGTEQKFTEEWLQQLRYENFRIRKLERLDGNIGYLKLLSFVPLEPAKQTITGAMNFLLYSSAIVIDLRENGGGSAETMNFMLSYFLNDSVQVSQLRYRKNNNTITTYTTKDAAINKISPDIPLYILVSNRTSSAAEAFAYTLQQYKRATVIGEQTKGEGNPGKLFVINQDLYIMIPTAEAINPVSKISIDGIGITPDIPVDKAKALPKALLEAYSSLAQNTTIDELKTLYTWQLPFYKNEVDPEPLSQQVISSIVGDYMEGRKIIYENNAIYYINTAGTKEKLDYIGNGTFQNAEKNWLRLVMPSTDNPIPSFQWIWQDGGDPQTVTRSH